MPLTQIPPEVLKRGDVFFEVFIEQTIGKPFAEYQKEQEQIKTQLSDYKSQLKKIKQKKLLLEQQVITDKHQVEQEKLLLKQKAEQEKLCLKRKRLLLQQQAEQEKLLLQQKESIEKAKVEEQQQTNIYELSKLLSPAHIAAALKMKEEDIVKIIGEYNKS